MPKLKKKILTENVFVYVRKTNRKFLDAQARRQKISRSSLIDHLLDTARKQEMLTRIKVVTQDVSPTT